MCKSEVAQLRFHVLRCREEVEKIAQSPPRSVIWAADQEYVILF